MPVRVALPALVIALALPIGIFSLADRKLRWEHLAAGAWVLAAYGTARASHSSLGGYAWAALAAIALAAWGIRDNRPDRINMGVAGFAITVLVFYFSNVMDKLDRSMSLIGFGLVFLAGGWLLEKTRRKLVVRAKAAGGAA